MRSSTICWRTWSPPRAHASSGPRASYRAGRTRTRCASAPRWRRPGGAWRVRHPGGGDRTGPDRCVLARWPPPPDPMTDRPALERVLSLPVLVLYGLGTIVGAGIYALIGKVAGEAGAWAPIAFIVAATMASLTALSFCELSARLPRAGGEAVYVDAGLRARWLTIGVGVAMVVVACLSAATVARGFAGYAGTLAPLSHSAAILLLLAVLGAVAAWGIGESAWLASALTLVEVGGLLVVIVAGADRFAELPARIGELVPPASGDAWLAIGSASLLCFYAFLGFEDMVNVAEEVRDVQRVM
ncbi:MAG TPA: APC family permease, partial [Alphaproteobacteria bacterium]|nr:APC family permease [Alphaproteobacteria bacterium]